MEHIERKYLIAKEAYRRLIGAKRFYLKDDLIQMAVLHLIRKDHEFDPIKSSYETWAKKTATNRMIDILDKEKRKSRAMSLSMEIGNDLLLEDIVCDNEALTHFDILDYQNLLRKLRVIANDFSLHQRMIIALHLKHYTQEQISARVNVSRQAVAKFLTKFRSLVHQALEEC